MILLEFFICNDWMMAWCVNSIVKTFVFLRGTRKGAILNTENRRYKEIKEKAHNIEEWRRLILGPA